MQPLREGVAEIISRGKRRGARCVGTVTRETSLSGRANAGGEYFGKTIMIQLLNGAWRKDLSGIASTADQSVLIAAPYIKYEEAVWFCELLRPGVEVISLVNIDAEAVSASALDVTALRCLAEASPFAKLIALSNLHAKVFVVDEKAAIVTSGNLTIRKDMLSFARLGSQVDTNTIVELASLETGLRFARANITSSTTPDAKRRFAKVMRQARPVLASLQVGKRSAHAVFGEAIQFIPARGPQTTKAIQREVSQLMPTLCDDREYLIIKGERYGKAWKRRFRHAQLHLKRRGVVTYNAISRTWSLTRS